APSYTAAFADALIKIAEKDSRIVAITAAMPSGTGLDKFQSAFPDSSYDVGICEQHAVTFAAGLACEGKVPVCAIYSTFLQRAYDQVVHDVCLQDLPVVFAMDRAGVVGNDGETHQGVFDIAYLGALPNMIIMSPKDENELQHMLYTATQHHGPTALRYPRGNGLGVTVDHELRCLPIGKGEILRNGDQVLLIAFGPVVKSALEVAGRLESELGITPTVINARFAKPLDTELLSREIPRHQMVCTIEDHSLCHGFGSLVLEHIAENSIELESSLQRFGVGAAYVPHANQEEQHILNGYDAESIFQALSKQLEPNRLKAAG
ncbi:MAG: 1-deoxy-D-xylulose-5-phosphate synthase, partial [Bdellovibrionales bacterium]|nr:1-deoxy-D-xylulose-5-phosphate synthase [Bdellovibrionales bacterium]